MYITFLWLHIQKLICSSKIFWTGSVPESCLSQDGRSKGNKNIYFSIPHISVKHLFLFFVAYALVRFAFLCFISAIEIVVQIIEHFLVVEQSNSLIIRYLLEKVTDCTNFGLPTVGTDCIVS